MRSEQTIRKQNINLKNKKMKTVVGFVFGIFLMMAFLVPKTLVAQTQQEMVEVPVHVWNPCGNNGEGEFMIGTVKLHSFEIMNTNAAIQKWHQNVSCSDLVGEFSGDVYHATGGVDPKWTKNTFQLNNYQRFIGPDGSMFVLKIFLHSTTNANGDTTAEFADVIFFECL